MNATAPAWSLLIACARVNAVRQQGDQWQLISSGIQCCSHPQESPAQVPTADREIEEKRLILFMSKEWVASWHQSWLQFSSLSLLVFVHRLLTQSSPGAGEAESSSKHPHFLKNKNLICWVISESTEATLSCLRSIEAWLSPSIINKGHPVLLLT